MTFGTLSTLYLVPLPLNSNLDRPSLTKVHLLIQTSNLISRSTAVLSTIPGQTIKIVSGFHFSGEVQNMEDAVNANIRRLTSRFLLRTMMEKAAIRMKKYADCIALHLSKKATADKCLFSHSAPVVV